MKINYCDKNILAAHTICMYHILFMHLSGIPKQILHKTNSFRQQQNRDLWIKTHCRTGTLLAIKVWPYSLIPSLTPSILAPFPKNHFWLIMQETAEANPPQIAQEQQKFIWTQKKFRTCQKKKNMQNSTQRGLQKQKTWFTEFLAQQKKK